MKLNVQSKDSFVVSVQPIKTLCELTSNFIFLHRKKIYKTAALGTLYTFFV